MLNAIILRIGKEILKKRKKGKTSATDCFPLEKTYESRKKKGVEKITFFRFILLYCGTNNDTIRYNT